MCWIMSKVHRVPTRSFLSNIWISLIYFYKKNISIKPHLVSVVDAFLFLNVTFLKLQTNPVIQSCLSNFFSSEKLLRTKVTVTPKAEIRESAWSTLRLFWRSLAGTRPQSLTRRRCWPVAIYVCRSTTSRRWRIWSRTRVMIRASTLTRMSGNTISGRTSNARMNWNRLLHMRPLHLRPRKSKGDLLGSITRKVFDENHYCTSLPKSLFFTSCFFMTTIVVLFL